MLLHSQCARTRAFVISVLTLNCTVGHYCAQADAASAAVDMLMDSGAVEQAVYVATHCRCTAAVYERVLAALQLNGSDDHTTRDRLAEGECCTLHACAPRTSAAVDCYSLPNP